MMRRPPPLEVGEIFRRFGGEYLQDTVGHGFPGQEKAIRNLTQCRTSALGGQRYRCERCARETVVYHSCRDRHCPKCQATARADWVNSQESNLLPVPYFHVVFTLPSELNDLALRNKRLVYGCLFRAASRTLLQVGRDPRQLGVELGFLAVLHTWGQNLQLHPHLHCVVPGGGFAAQAEWKRCRRDFFLPVRILSNVFRGKMVSLLRKALQASEIDLPADVTTGKVSALLDSVFKKDWIVYAKRPFGGPRQVLKYLARYTHRVAISNQRLVALEGRRVIFRWKDRSHGGRSQQTMALDAVEFLRRFLLHLLPSGFQRIRHYGFLANRVRQEKLELARRELGARPGESAESPRDAVSEVTTEDSGELECRRPCPHCGKGSLVLVESLDPIPRAPRGEAVPLLDTS